jgi:Mg2+-importing ATPase
MGDGINDAPALHAADVGISVDGAADVARAAADLILLEHDLSVVREAVVHGRSTVQNVSKYVLMGSSSNFGNMFIMAGAALFLPFLPMLPIQILLNNLLYDVSEIAIPFDRVDPEVIAGPVKWDVKLIEKFMLVFGPVSSVFDFLTFYALLRLFGAGEVKTRGEPRPDQDKPSQIAARTSSSRSPMPPVKTIKSTPSRTAIIAATCLRTE